MMAENPNWWNMNPPSLNPPQYLLGSSSIPFNSLTENPEPPQPWSQLLFTELPREEERVGFSHFQSKKFENWDDHILNPSTRDLNVDVIKQEGYQSVNFYGHEINEEFHQTFEAGSPWSHIVQVSNNSPGSNVTTLSSSNLLDFTYNNADNTSKCISKATSVACKKAKGQPSSSQPPIKVRKEKLGDRVTALHHIVSPFGKTDTASVLLEAIGYIRFLQGQIEALTSPYLGNVSENIRNQHSVMSDIGLKRKGAPNQDTKDKAKDLRSRGLCLVPVSCTQHVGSENGADCWSANGSGF
ncbi:hypothetical protein Lal_00017464 [Lupinus albus]|uniref:Putative transcription factor bHLH family n=1 Tax=Lupinus albus TaxID=3870 RepID=A0A6A4QNB8_LUPAL|nr:putative transcription factor bHLH family [Lupinus albus]KAF1869887.1 hypothetical protein Lal_00017464 [Lupinus albus]